MRRKIMTSMKLQALARTRLCRELVQNGMPLKDALKEAQIQRCTYDRYLPVLKKMPSWQLIELPVPAKRKNRNFPG
jgi:hypothetical protein